MTRFEEVGTDIQYSAHSKDQAVKCFKRSCELCCTKGIRIDCDRCAIASTHNSVVEAFESKVKAPLIAEVLVCMVR